MTETIETTTENEAAPLDTTAPEMQVKLEQVSDVERKLAVEIPWTEAKKRLDEAYRELQQGVTIKGFRKGKVPRKMLEQLFGKHVTKEVSQRLVQDSINAAIKDHGLSPVSEPEVVDEGLKEGEIFRYTATLQVVPEIDPQNYFGVEAKMRPAKVSDEEVEVALRAKQRENTDYRSIEGRPTQAGDVVLVDILGKLGDEAYDKPDQIVELGDSPGEPLPGLAAKLTGLPVDTEELQLELDVPVHQQGPTEGAEGVDAPATHTTQKARLLVTIKDVKQKIVPVLDDEFARDTGEAETLDGLKVVLRKKLLEQDEQRAREEAKQELLKTIVGRNSIPVVPALVERYLDQSIKLQMAMLGIDPQTAGIEQEPLKEHMRQDAEERVKSGILLEAVAKKEKVDVQEADIEKKLAEIAASRSQNLARVRSEYEKEGRMASLRGRIREDKTLDLLMSKANITIEESPSTPGASAAE
jgi:trigger factor